MTDLNEALDKAFRERLKVFTEKYHTHTEAERTVATSAAFLASLAASGYAIVPVEATATHKKRGTTYDVISDLAFLQTDEPLTDMAEVVIYRCRDTGDYWVRRHAEFHDGRFMLAAAPKE